MEQEKDLQVIFIKDLLFAALYQWRRILVFGCIFALLLGAVAFALQLKNSAPAVSGDGANASAGESSAATMLQQKIQQMEQTISDQRNYMTESVLMTLDPYCVYKATSDILVETDYQILPGMEYQNPDKIQVILRAYYNHLNSDEVIQTISQVTGVKTKYLTELIYITLGDATTRSLGITVSYGDPEGAKQILDILIQATQDFKTQIEPSVGDHSINILPGNISERVDLTISDKQLAAIVRLNNLNVELANLQAQASALPAIMDVSGGISLKALILPCILGAFLGFVMVVFFIWVGHIGGTRVYSARTLKNRTGIRVLACIPNPGKRNLFIDRWLKKLEGRCLHKNQAALAAAAISNCAAGSKVLVAKSEGYTDLTLEKALEQAGVSFQLCGNLTQDADAIKALPNCDAVVLLEACHASYNADVEQSMELIADLKKPLLGCVLMNG